MSLLHKTENQKRNNDQLIKLMSPMIAGIVACVFCLVSMTWAWFTASVNAPAQTIQSATRIAAVTVYELGLPDDSGNSAKTLIKPKMAQTLALAEETQATESDASEILAGDALVWELSPEKEYEIVMTGSGTATTGYCEVELSQTDSLSTTPQITKYKTAQFEKDQAFTFTYKTGGFASAEGVTKTKWKEYVENTNPTLKISSHWGKLAEEVPESSLMSLRGKAKEKIMLLSDGDVVGLAPIPCPEAKAETEVELEGFEMQEGAEISAEEDYKVSLTLKEGFEMPSEVVVNIGGKDYVVSTQGTEASADTPYYDTQTGVLTVPSSLLSDGVTVSVKATATQIPVEEPKEEKTEEETTAKNMVADNPTKKEDDEQDSDKPEQVPAGNGGKDDNDEDHHSGGSSSGNASSTGNHEEKTEEEKADVTLNLSQLTINLEETKIPTNADLVLSLSAKEDMELPKQIVITLDKTIRDENIEDDEITEDKTEYVIHTDGKDNPEGFAFDVESGALTISSELLEGVREITIADTEQNEANENENKAALTFEVKNLTFDFTDNEIVTDEDVVITFTAGEGYALPETIMITIDGEEYVVYTSAEDSDKNPDGITFDMETGTLTISKNLLKDAEAITIAAEGVKKEDEESEGKEENPDADKKDESEDKDNSGKENETEFGETTDKETEAGTDTPNTGDKTEPEGGTCTPNTEDKTEPEGGTDVSNGENTEGTNPETTPDDTTEGDNNGEDNGESKGETETLKPGTEPTTPTTPGTEDNTNTEQGDENVETEEKGEGSTENGAEETTPDTESGNDDETTTPTEPTTPSTVPSEPVVTPETPKTDNPGTSESTTGGNDGDDNSGTGSNVNDSTESNSNSGNDSAESNASGESTTVSSPSVAPTAPTTSAPASSETNTPSTNINATGASQSSGTTTSSESQNTSSEE